MLERLKTMSKLKKANVECSDIVKVTGHRSVQSLDDYDEADEEEQRRLSSAIAMFPVTSRTDHVGLFISVVGKNTTWRNVSY